MTKRISVQLAAGVALAFLASVVYMRMLGDREQYYMLMFYILVGAAFYVMSKYFGKEVYILLLVPRIIIGGNLAYLFFNISNNDMDMQNPFKTHIFTLVWLVAFLLEFAEMMYREELQFDWKMILLILVVALFSAVTLAGRGGKGLSILLENYYGPFSFFMIFYMKKDISFLRMKKVLNVLLVAILVLALFGIFEYAAKSHPFASYFDASGMLRLRSAEKYRVLGTVGHILFPILMLAGCMIVRHNIRRFWVRLPVYVFLIGAATLSQTRVLLMACIFYVVGTEVALAISRSRGELAGLVKPLVAAAALLGVAAVALMQSAAGKQLMERFFSDAGSGKARIIQIEYFLNNIFSMPMYGIGAFADTVVLTDPDTGAQIIAEIPWINLYFEVGPLFLLLLLVFLFAVIFSGPLWFELLVLMGAFSPYTTLTSKTCCFFLFFVFAAYSITMKRQKASAAADTTDRPLYPVLPPGRRRGVAAVVCAGVLALVLAAGAAAGAAKVAVEEKLYRASADLMVVLEPELPEDVAFAQQEGGQAVRYSRYIGDDIVAMAHSDQIIYLMREKFYKETGTWLARADYSERLQLANMYESRVVRVYYSDTDPERAALVATCFAGAIEEFTTKLGGFRQVKVAEEAAVPVGYVAPRPVAVTVVMALFAATVFLIGFLGVGAIGNLVRDYGQPLVIFEKRMFKRPRKGKPLAQGRVVYRSAGRGGGEGGAGR